MRKRLVVMGLLAAFAATGAAAAASQHFATASTKKEAKRLATVEARATARTSALCFRPAYQVAECEKVESGFRCRADSASDPRTCRRSGWLNDSASRVSSTYAAWESGLAYGRYGYKVPDMGAPYAYSSAGSYYPVGGMSVTPGWRPAEPVVMPPIFAQQPSFAKN